MYLDYITNMEFRVVRVEVDPSSPYDDCRCIDRIAYEVADTVMCRSPCAIYDKLEAGPDFYFGTGGKRTYLQTARRGRQRYVRTEPSDTEHDALLVELGS
jgi:hypothetical protein